MASSYGEFLDIVQGQLPSKRDRYIAALADPEAIELFGSGCKLELKNRQAYFELLGNLSVRLMLWPEEVTEVVNRLSRGHANSVKA